MKVNQAPQEQNDRVRSLLQNHIELYGTTKAFVAKKVELDKSTIGKFLKGTINLSAPNLTRLEKFLGMHERLESWARLAAQHHRE